MYNNSCMSLIVNIIDSEFYMVIYRYGFLFLYLKTLWSIKINRLSSLSFWWEISLFDISKVQSKNFPVLITNKSEKIKNKLRENEKNYENLIFYC
jgi:hypothetical protein